MVETGQFATLWKKMAEKLGLKPEFITTDWRIGADPEAIEAHCARTPNKEIKAVCVLHNETSTGALSPIADIRKAIDAAGHPALFMVDTISSLASTDYRHDEWGVDVSVGGAQKGLMLPPGMSFNAVSDKALAAIEDLEAAEVVLRLGRHAEHEQDRLLPLHAGDADAARPRRRHRHAARGRPRQRVRPPRPPRRGDAARGAGLGPRESCARTPSSYSPTITAVLLPEGHDADAFRALALDTFNIAYGASFGPYAGKYFRIGHLGDINDGTLIGALGITEMALALAGIPHKKGGVQAAMDYIVSAHAGAKRAAAE